MAGPAKTEENGPALTPAQAAEVARIFEDGWVRAVEGGFGRKRSPVALMREVAAQAAIGRYTMIPIEEGEHYGRYAMIPIEEGEQTGVVVHPADDDPALDGGDWPEFLQIALRGYAESKIDPPEQHLSYIASRLAGVVR